MFLCSALLLASAALAQELPQPDSTPVSLYGAALRDAESRLVGRGVALGGAATRANVRALGAAEASICGTAAEIVWREVRRETDPEGGTHVFYRQHLVGGNVDAELVGSEIAVHRMPNGRLLGIGGRQFESVTVSGCPAISAAKAIETARERVLLHRGEYAQHREPWTMNATQAARLAQTKLKLVQIDGTFRPSYFTVADDGSGEPHLVVLDAVDQRLLAIREANPGNNCTPDTPLNLVTAYSDPVRPELPNWRTIKANVASRADGYTHEGVTVSTDGLSRQLVYQETTRSAYKCTSGNYTLFPVKIDSSVNCCSPVYKDILVPMQVFFYGNSAGDALWFTHRTINTFKNMGRAGWDNANGDAKIVIRETGTSDGGKFIYYSTGDAPLNSVTLGPPSYMYSSAASLDLVAHEWGHGVIFTSANFNIGTTNGLQFHEGFSDVIGMLVEKRVQGSGTGLEQSSDWVMHEDMATSGYARGAIDDGTGGHSWTGPGGTLTFDDRLHRLDGTEDPNNPHATGNLLNVAHLIMAAGGSTTLPSGLNPVCARLSVAGCESSNAVGMNEYLGSSKAGSIFFHAIQFTLTSSTTWSDVADRMTDAAFQKFHQCHLGPTYNAWQEQRAVRKAFAGIGHPRTYTQDIQCP